MTHIHNESRLFHLPYPDRNTLLATRYYLFELVIQPPRFVSMKDRSDQTELADFPTNINVF